MATLHDLLGSSESVGRGGPSFQARGGPQRGVTADPFAGLAAPAPVAPAAQAQPAPRQPAPATPAGRSDAAARQAAAQQQASTRLAAQLAAAQAAARPVAPAAQAMPAQPGAPDVGQASWLGRPAFVAADPFRRGGTDSRDAVAAQVLATYSCAQYLAMSGAQRHEAIRQALLHAGYVLGADTLAYDRYDYAITARCQAFAAQQQLRGAQQGFAAPYGGAYPAGQAYTTLPGGAGGYDVTVPYSPAAAQPGASGVGQAAVSPPRQSTAGLYLPFAVGGPGRELPARILATYPCGQYLAMSSAQRAAAAAHVAGVSAFAPDVAGNIEALALALCSAQAAQRRMPFYVAPQFPYPAGQPVVPTPPPPEVEAMPAPVAPASPPGPGAVGLGPLPQLGPLDAWLAMLRLSADGWLDLPPGWRGALVAGGGCPADGVPTLCVALDAHCAAHTGRVPVGPVSAPPAPAPAPPPPTAPAPAPEPAPAAWPRR